MSTHHCAAQYLITALDAADDDAKQRRLTVRADHIALGDEMVASGEKLYGCAILTDGGDMTGSVAVVEFPDRAALDRYLAREPYVTGRVWGTIDITPCRRHAAPLPPFRESDFPPTVRTQSLVIARDGTGADAVHRRVANTKAHTALARELVQRSELLYEVDILDEAGTATGSMLIVDFPTQGDLDGWLAGEPFVTGAVWDEVEVRNCRVGPSQQGLHHPFGSQVVR